MKVRYFKDTDTLHVELSDLSVTETKELNENLFFDLDSDGRVVSFTIEPAKASSGKTRLFLRDCGGIEAFSYAKD